MQTPIWGLTLAQSNYVRNFQTQINENASLTDKENNEILKKSLTIIDDFRKINGL